MLQCVHKAHFLSFSFKSVSSVFRQFLLLCDTGQAFSSLAPTLVHQAFCSSFYPPPLHLSGSKIWLVFGSSTYLLAHTGCSYLSSVSNACSITYQHFHMVAFSRSFCECAIYFWGSDFPVDKLYFFLNMRKNSLGSNLVTLVSGYKSLGVTNILSQQAYSVTVPTRVLTLLLPWSLHPSSLYLLTWKRKPWSCCRDGGAQGLC